jgi:hypothetical protein
VRDASVVELTEGEVTYSGEGSTLVNVIEPVGIQLWDTEDVGVDILPELEEERMPEVVLLDTRLGETRLVERGLGDHGTEDV